MRFLISVWSGLLALVLHAQQWNWAASAGGGGNVDFCYDIATDSQGNAYWVGSVSGNVDFGCGSLATGSSDILGFVAKRAPDGSCVWVRGIVTTLFEAWAYGIAIDAEDRIYVTGKFEGNAAFGNGVALNGYSGDDIFLARYDTDGNCSWARRAGGNADDEARGLEVSAAGDVFLTGTCGGTTINFDGITIANPANYRQVLVARYDSTGTVQWAKASTGNGQGKSARGITVANDRLFVTGQVAFNAATFDGLELTPGAQGSFLYVLATDLDGNALWARSFGRGDHEGMGISADTLGNVFVAGRLWGDLQLPDDTLNSVSSNDDILVMKLDHEGGFQWARSTGSSTRDLAWGVAADGMGNAYFCGQFNQTIDFFGSPVTSLGSEDIFISKLDGEGQVVWVARPSGYQRDIALCIHRRTTAPHELFFGGYFWGAITYGNTTIDDVLNGDAMIVAGVDTTFHVNMFAAPICPGACDGEALVFAQGDGPFTFAWSNGAETPSITGLCEGEYLVTITDGNGVVHIDTVQVEERSDPGFTVLSEADSLWVEGGAAWQWYLDGDALTDAGPWVNADVFGDYHALVTDAEGCTWSTDTVTYLTTNIREWSNEGFRVFPNPADDRLNFMVDAAAYGKKAVVEIYEASGRQVYTEQLTGLQGVHVLDLSAVTEAGLYLMILRVEGQGPRSARVVVQR